MQTKVEMIEKIKQYIYKNSKDLPPYFGLKEDGGIGDGFRISLCAFRLG